MAGIRMELRGEENWIDLGENSMGSGTDSPGTGWLGTVVAFLDDQCLGIPPMALARWGRVVICPSPQRCSQYGNSWVFNLQPHN